MLFNLVDVVRYEQVEIKDGTKMNICHVSSDRVETLRLGKYSIGFKVSQPPQGGVNEDKEDHSQRSKLYLYLR